MSVLKRLPIFGTGVDWSGYTNDGKIINECSFTLCTRKFRFVFADEELTELYMDDQPITEKKFRGFLNLKVFW